MNDKTTKGKSFQTCSFSVRFISLQSHKSVLFQKRADMNMFCYKDSYEMEALGPSFSQLNRAIIIFILNQGRQEYDKAVIRTQLFRI